MGRSHRLSYQIHHGDIVGGLWVLHRCNNNRCVRPDHLYLGNHAQNMRDMTAAGRSTRKLTDDAVRDIRSNGMRQRDAAAKYGVDQNAIWLIRHRRTYAYVA